MSSAVHYSPVAWRCGRFHFDWQKRTMPVVMGILNITPDSFSDGGQFQSHDVAIAHAYQMIEEGAEIIDIGGESSRPGAEALSLQEELDRVIPIIDALKNSGVALSIDTYKSKTMKAALDAGVDILNDIWGFRQPHALEVAASSSQAGLCVMHMQKDPSTMQFNPEYEDVVDDVNGFLMERVVALEEFGIERERIAIDPGFGFGKMPEHNLKMLNQFETFTLHGLPVLAGISRKATLGVVTGRDKENRMVASVAAALMAVERGAKIVRVHDVAATVDAMKLWAATKTESLEGK
jgi:dihydropteroate synthase